MVGFNRKVDAYCRESNETILAGGRDTVFFHEPVGVRLSHAKQQNGFHT